MPLPDSLTVPAATPDGTSSARFWHPFADMSQVAGDEFVVTGGDDVWVTTEDGRRFLDATASLWCVNVGHGRTEIATAVQQQFGRIESFSTFGDFGNVPATELADRIARLAPVDDAKVLFASGGGDGVDTAARLARQYFAATGQPNRTHLISRSSAYHGTHGWGISLAGIEANRSGNGPTMPDISFVPFDDVDALDLEIQRVGPDRIAAFFCEPILGAGGVHLPPDGYLTAVSELCREYGILFVVDAVICGFGRLGTWFGIERWDVRPDMAIFAKGVTSGYLPLGGVVVSGEIAAPFWSPGGPVFRHGATYAGHPVCCAAALANLELLEQDDLLERGRTLERPLHDRLAPLAASDAVAEVRGGMGLLAAVELAPDLLAENPGAVAAGFRAAREAGVLLRPLGSSLAVSPPLTIDEAGLDVLADGLRAAIEAVAR